MKNERGLSPMVVLLLAAVVGVIAIEAGTPRGALATMNRPRHRRQMMVHLFGIGMLYFLVRYRARGENVPAGTAAVDAARPSAEEIAKLLAGSAEDEAALAPDVARLEGWLRETEPASETDGPTDAARPGGLAELRTLVESLRVRTLGAGVQVANGRLDLVAEEVQGLQESASEASEWLSELERSLAGGPADPTRPPDLTPEARLLLHRVLKYCDESSNRTRRLRQLVPAEGASR